MGKKDQSPLKKKRDWKPGERSKISLMQAFRAAHDDHDARKRAERNSDDEIEILNRSKQRREGVSDEALRQHLQEDLISLLNTTQLAAIVPLEDHPHIEQSVLNYGFPDFSKFSREELSKPHVLNAIRQSLLDHEPRLRHATLDVSVANAEADTGQRLSIHVSAELVNDPVDIPVDFEAEVDLGAGKLAMQQVRAQV